MKRLTCEMCGSVDLVKQDGLFVCQACETKYSVEEARKMMIEGTVEVKGTVKVDDSDEIKKLFQAARNARETSDDATALRHYEAISAKVPDSWEALFYLVILKTNSIKNGEIGSAAVSVANSIDRVFELIDENVSDVKDKKAAVEEVVEQCYITAKWLASASREFYNTMTKGNGLMALTGISGMISSVTSTNEAISEDQDRCFHIAKMMYACGNAVETYFGMEDEDFRTYAIFAWKMTLELNAEFSTFHKNNLGIFAQETLETIYNKINRYYNGPKRVITVNRSSSLTGAATTIIVCKDGIEVFRLKWGESNSFETTDEPFELVVKQCDTNRSQSFQVEAGEENLDFEVKYDMWSGKLVIKRV